MVSRSLQERDVVDQLQDKELVETRTRPQIVLCHKSRTYPRQCSF